TYEEFNDDRLLSLAPGVVFYGLLALFPAITALVSSYALFADPATITGHLATLKSVLPQGAYGIIDQQVTRIASTTTGDLSLAFFGSLAIALWSANSGLKAIIDALNIVYGVKEWRSFIRLNVVSLIMTAGTIVGLLLAMAAVVAVPIVLSYLPLGSWGAAIMAWLRWPALLLLVMLGLALLYRFGPNRDNPRWEFLSPGAVFAAAAWLAGSALLSWYLSNFADYGATYGSLGAAIGLMMWLWMSAIVVLLGAELNAQIDAARDAIEKKSESTIGRA
ncbi:MAG: YihY/virulence factor BrkB family protein, partial [Pseudolabrys sp.]